MAENEPAVVPQEQTDAIWQQTGQYHELKEEIASLRLKLRLQPVRYWLAVLLGTGIGALVGVLGAALYFDSQPPRTAASVHARLDYLERRQREYNALTSAQLDRFLDEEIERQLAEEREREAAERRAAREDIDARVQRLREKREEAGGGVGGGGLP